MSPSGLSPPMAPGGDRDVPLGRRRNKQPGTPRTFLGGVLVQAPPPPRTSGESPWSTLGAQWVPTPAPRNPVQPGGVALTPTEPCLLRGARGACTRAGTRGGTGTTTVTGRNTLTHQTQAPGCTQPPHCPPQGTARGLGGTQGGGGWLGDTLHWGVGVLPMGAGGVKGGGGCQED